MGESKTALVTGGSRGIGRAVCERLAKDGFDVFFNYRKNEEEAKATVELCKKYNVRAEALCADISSSADCERFIEEAKKFGNGRIDVLVNNAGITKDNLIIRMSDDELDEVLNVNLKGSFYMMRGVSRIMLRQKSGSIVNISSAVGLKGNAGQINYAAAKAGIIGMTKSLARELSSRHIRVNAIAPGMIETDMTAVLSDETVKTIIENIPFKSIGKPEDVAGAVAFLAGEDSTYITGQVICVDGGMAI